MTQKIASSGRRSPVDPVENKSRHSAPFKATHAAENTRSSESEPHYGADLGRSTSQEASAAFALLNLQDSMRSARSKTELGYFIANEARSALQAQQIVVFTRGIASEFIVQTVSSITKVERSSALVQGFERGLKRLSAQADIGTLLEFDSSVIDQSSGTGEHPYPLRHILWVPFRRMDGAVIGGAMMARTVPWTDHDCKVASYLGGAFGHAWSLFEPQSAVSLVRRYLSRRVVLSFLGALAVLLMVPVPMTALAPVEISPIDSLVVTSGVEGIIESVEVEPNTVVEAGQVLVTLSDTVLRNRTELAKKEVAVADAKYKRAAQLAFVDPRGRHEMAIALSELELKNAELNYSRDLLKRTVIRAERAGVAFFADKKELVGKPVAVGEKLMEVADPKRAELRMELPVADAIVLRDGARVKIFLDSRPLAPFEATVVRTAYKAAVSEGQNLTYRVVARAANQDDLARLGGRGTAQIYSDSAPLGFYLFRKPIAAFRQWSGL